ncbi:MAG: type II toxin-antitoxin system VapC family toxin [Patescibacteria group bacterium]
MKSYVLDSFALLVFLQKEPGSGHIHDILQKARKKQATVFFSEISLGEVYYILIRSMGLGDAKIALAHILALPMTVIPAELKDVLAAAEYKSRGAISYADCFVVALGETMHATVVTGDREFAAFEKDVEVSWIIEK